MRLSPGTRLGPYEVLATLGSGGMSEVYRARDSRLHREVAIKVVGEALTGDPGFLGRLEREARLAGSLNHPNIVAVHDIGVHDGAPYVVTELLQGETLRERLARGPVPLGQALDWAGQIAQALAAAHAHGIIHRDLKPENVFLTRLGQVKLLDFGIAKASPRVSEPRGLLEPTMSPAGSATRTGAVLGTPGYMSPEQVRGEHVDPRSDIFSLGIILHELLSGQRAFRAGSIVESGYSILHDEPPPLPPSVPVGVAQLVQHCLAKDPDARFQSARDVALSLDVLRGTGASTPATPLAPQGRTARRMWRFLWPAVALLLVLAAFAAGRGNRTTRRPPVVQQLTGPALGHAGLTLDHEVPGERPELRSLGLHRDRDARVPPEVCHLLIRHELADDQLVAVEADPDDGGVGPTVLRHGREVGQSPRLDERSCFGDQLGRHAGCLLLAANGGSGRWVRRPRIETSS